MLNLLSNAVKYNREGGDVVLAATSPDPRTILISVHDTGIGIAPADLERVFVPFEKAHRQRIDVPGTGLGLSLARKYVELHGGRLWAESSGVDQGATFSFTLPLQQAWR